jgi:hypothetical protein
MDVPSQADMLRSIDAFLARHPSIGESAFGRRATGEPGLLDRLRKGSSPTLRVAGLIGDYMARVDAEHAATTTSAVDTSSCGKAEEVSAEVAA